MNYRHAYHAGNFAEVVKHAVFARVLTHLLQKPAAFRIIDTHAGPGCTDLTGREASRTGEWRDGVGRLLAADLAPALRAGLSPYLDAVVAANPPGRLITYPGSPMLARAFLRAQDRLIACELEPQARAALARHLHGDDRIKVIAIDGFTALKAYVPPRERRGVVLIDPPFEQPGEFSRMQDGLAAAHRKWPAGTYLLWYPIKDVQEVATFARGLARLGIAKMLRIEVLIAAPAHERLAGTGLVAVNPPWTLADDLEILLPALTSLLARDHHARCRVEWIAGEK
jgi:23S rRNA (adenine2030-N6)-methyltransferase